MESDPWKQISRPFRAEELVARRTGPEHPFNFFWARDPAGHCLLVFEYSDSIELRDRRPYLSEIKILEPRMSGHPARFILELLHEDNREIFHQLCLDIIDSTRACPDESSALSTILRRTWRWHRLLKGGGDQRLGQEEQKGLLGELRVLELAFLPTFSASDALDFWHGPDGSPKDFSVGTSAVEAKAKRGASRPYVSISSEHQLDITGLENLFLAVTFIDEGAQEMPHALTLTGHIDRIMQIVEKGESGALGYLENKLHDAGYSSDHDYSDRHWIIGDTTWYRVSDEFPRISHPELPDGVRDVTYSLDLAGCESWRVDMAAVLSALKGDSQ